MQNDNSVRKVRLYDDSWTDSDSEVAVRLGVRKEPCVICGLPVFLAEKLVISRSLYHRTCFRCARCNNQLTLGNYYETEEGQYCCETCPDEEIAAAPIMHQDYNQTALLGGRGGDDIVNEYETATMQSYKRALSDEEKTSERRNYKPIGAHSAEHVTKASDSSSSSEVAKIRLNFMTSHLLAGNEENDVPPSNVARKESPHPVDKENRTLDESDHRKTETETHLPAVESPLTRTSPLIDCKEFEDGGEMEKKEDNNYKITGGEGESVNIDEDRFEDKLDSSSRDNQHSTAITTHDLDSKSFIKLRKNENTKDTLAVSGDKAPSDSAQRLSLVQQRMKIFENSKRAEKGEGGKKDIAKANEPNSVVNISSKRNNAREMDQAEEKIAKTSRESSPTIEETNPDTKIIEESSKQEDSSENIQVEYDTAKDLELPEEKPITAAVILQKMIDSQEPRKNLSSVDTSLSNVSGVDLSLTGEYPEDLNPFQSDDSDGNEKEKLRRSPADDKTEKYVSTNPFGSSDDEDDQKETTPPQPAARKNSSSGNKAKDNEPPARRRLQAPQISLNPFWSDEEDQESDDDNGAKTEKKNTPVPKPRKMKTTPEPSPVPRKTSLNREGLYASNSSITSTGSLITPGGTYRKKKPAPPPPPAEEMFSSTATFDTIVKSPDDTQTAKAVSPFAPRARKMKPAPPPPMSTSTPQSMNDSFSAEVNETEEHHPAIWDDQKNSKDETNRNRQSLSTVSSIDDGGQHYNATFIDKSAQGKWKRKKGPAPPRPLPHKRKIKVMSVKDVKLELDEIELQQQGLEKQGVRLEQLIRDKSETGQENEEFTSLRLDVEELVLELFALVNEKNELFRRQAELMLLRRQQRLEEEHADVEYQIRCLMSQPEATKTDSDKQREESLIQRLVDIVERRNEIVECLEMDRRREVEEDRSINEQMGIFAAKSKGDLNANSDALHSSSIPKKEKAKEKVKEKKIKKSHKKDADKDVDETEMKLKRHKKKWF